MAIEQLDVHIDGVDYKITQLVKNAYCNRAEVIYETAVERYARTEFKRLKDNWPDEHFELFKVVHEEECLEWSGK